jgi:hypothetical protein
MQRNPSFYAYGIVLAITTMAFLFVTSCTDNHGKGHSRKKGDEITRFTLPNEQGDTKVLTMQIRTSGGTPVTECYQVHATNFSDSTTTVEVTWHKRDGSGNEDPPEKLTKGDDDSQISDCHCNDLFDQVTIKVTGGTVTIIQEKCTK